MPLTRKNPCVLIIFAIILAVLACVLYAKSAYAEDIETDPQADEYQQEVERTAKAYEESLAKVEAAEKALKENRNRADELEVSIPAQQAKSDVAARELYKIEQQGIGILEMLLTSGSFHDFIAKLEYVTRVSQANIDEINRLASMKEELDTTQSALKKAKSDADAHAKEANEALEAAKQARKEAQIRAQEEARRQAEEAAAAAAAAEEAARAAEEEKARENSSEDTKPTESETAESKQNETEESKNAEAPDNANKKEDQTSKEKERSKNTDSNKESGRDTGSEPNPEPEPEPEQPAVTLDPPVPDGADWSSGQDAFVSEWASRIDGYLAGSPMAGQGKAFAKAAWDYGVDPRWSPAIAFVESTKGENCFNAHNAWGWGSESWGSWEEAINDHVRGLGRGYGYTISIEAAQKYCPPNWQSWYEHTAAQMNQI